MTRARIALACLLCIALGCEDAGPAELTCATAAVPLCLASDSTRAVLMPAVADARTRSAAALSSAVAKSSTQTELASVTDALEAGNVTLARAAAERLRIALTTAETQLASPGDAPDLAAIRLVLIQVDRALQ